jgi:APA family basic amino acid/polyamine antiporter
VAALAGFVSLDALADLTNIGTLFAFMLVSIAVVILRRRRLDLTRALRCRSRRSSRCWRASP